MHEELTLRLATVDDMPTLVRFRQAMWDDMGRTDGMDMVAHNAAFTQWVQDAMAAGTYYTWVLENTEGQIVACAGAWLTKSPPTPHDATRYKAHIMNVYTDRAYRRRGLAKRMMQVILDWCRAEGIQTVFLHASDEGRSLYEKFGFRSGSEMVLKLID